ncbi:MAG: guanylate kinase [Solobacterium sp.]|nr:guanylate kinase [Solobacterium sp.]
MNKGLLIVMSGPSGVGKGTILAELMDDEELKSAYSVSMTSRKMREGETNGVNYWYVTKEEFQEAVERGELLEWAEFVGNYYGTPVKGVEELRAQGKNVLLEIEIEGCKQVKKKCPDALTIYVIPPNMEELERRIRGRQTEPEDVIEGRLAKARIEMEQINEYSYVVCNETVAEAAEIIRNIILNHMKQA